MSKRVEEIKKQKEESYLQGGFTGQQKGSFAKKLAGVIIDGDSTDLSPEQKVFAPIQQKIKSDKTLIKIDFNDIGTKFDKLSHKGLKYFYHEIMLKNPNIILFDKDTREAFKRLLG